MSKIIINLAFILFIAKKITILSKYSNYINIFLKNFIAKLSKQTNFNEYAIDLIKSKQPLY